MHRALARYLRQLWYRQGYTSTCAQSASRTPGWLARGSRRALSTGHQEGSATALKQISHERLQFDHACSDLWGKEHIENLLLGLYRRCNNKQEILTFWVTRIGLQAKRNRRRPIH
jgi:hypothetical protein